MFTTAWPIRPHWKFWRSCTAFTAPKERWNDDCLECIYALDRAVSGVLGGLFKPTRGDIGWRLAFIGGLVGASLVYRLFATLPAVQIDASYAALVVAGLLVGVGTRYGSGCTSGHGVCGLSRLSPRSLVATLSFMGAGFATVFVVRHLFGI
ncbi:MAG: YeeE/YedE [Polaromonas sp. 35-63-240]|nr:MAG: YeeE/YedE [Polaromonas sp. 35-63-240]